MVKTSKLNGTDLNFPIILGSNPELTPDQKKCYKECNDLCHFRGTPNFNLKECRKDCDKICLKNIDKIDKEFNFIKNIESEIEQDICNVYSNEENCIKDCLSIFPPNLYWIGECINTCNKVNTLCKGPPGPGPPSPGPPGPPVPGPPGPGPPSPGPPGPSPPSDTNKYCYYKGSCTTNYPKTLNCTKYKFKSECDFYNSLGNVATIVPLIMLILLILFIIFIIILAYLIMSKKIKI